MATPVTVISANKNFNVSHRDLTEKETNFFANAQQPSVEAVSMAKGRMALDDENLLEAVEQAIETKYSEGDHRPKIYWETSRRLEKNNSIVQSVLQEVGLDTNGIELLFEKAKQIAL